MKIEDLDELKEITEGCDGIIFDEMLSDRCAKKTMVCLLDIKYKRTIRTRNTNATIPAKMPRIFICNEHGHPFSHDEAVGGHQKKGKVQDDGRDARGPSDLTHAGTRTDLNARIPKADPQRTAGRIRALSDTDESPSEDTVNMTKLEPKSGQRTFGRRQSKLSMEACWIIMGHHEKKNARRTPHNNHQHHQRDASIDILLAYSAW